MFTLIGYVMLPAPVPQAVSPSRSSIFDARDERRRALGPNGAQVNEVTLAPALQVQVSISVS